MNLSHEFIFPVRGNGNKGECKLCGELWNRIREDDPQPTVECKEKLRLQKEKSNVRSK